MNQKLDYFQSRQGCQFSPAPSEVSESSSSYPEGSSLLRESSNAKWDEGEQVKLEKSMAEGNGYSTPTTIGDIPQITTKQGTSRSFL